MIPVPKLIKVFDGVYLNIFCTMMNFIKEPLKTCCLSVWDLKRQKWAMGEVHEGICGIHQLAPKMKWLLCRTGFYWPTMMGDCFRYYKGCEECQRFDNI
jgi:hypothetical protein